jgi:hypothetical protein
LALTKRRIAMAARIGSPMTTASPILTDFFMRAPLKSLLLTRWNVAVGIMDQAGVISVSLKS